MMIGSQRRRTSSSTSRRRRRLSELTSEITCMPGSSHAPCTTEPVLHGAWLEPGMHVISLVNSDKRLRRREVDDEVLRRCDPIIISARDQVANDEPADIFDPLRAGIIQWDALTPMVELFASDHPGRLRDDQITLHKNNGLAIQFVAAAAVALQAACERGLGEKLPELLSSSGRQSRLV